MGSRLAWLDRRRQLCLSGPGGQRLSTAPDVAWGTWEAMGDEEVHSWPTWSPDGRRVASFRIAKERGLECHVRVTEADGVTASEIAELEGRLPIYLQWSPDGSRVRVLTQEGDSLHLEEAHADDLSPPKQILEGSPLFFEHHDDDVVAFVGEADGPALVVIRSDGKRHALPGVPGNFCAPMVLNDQVLYVVHTPDGMELVATEVDGTGPLRPMGAVRGLASLVGSPSGDRLAWAVDPQGTGAAYRSLSLLDPATGDSEQLTDLPLIAYLWQPDGLGLVGVEQIDPATLRWHRIGLDGYTRKLADLHATRDLRFFLRFFEQFGRSHALIDAESRHLVLAGGLTDRDDPRGTPRIWRVGLDDEQIDEVDEGMFATYAPRSS